MPPKPLRGLHRVFAGLTAAVLLLPVPAFAWTFVGPWVIADGTSAANASFYISPSNDKVLNITYTGPTPADTTPVSITLWRTVSGTATESINVGFTDNSNVDLSRDGDKDSLTVDAQLGTLTGSSGSRTFSGTSFTGMGSDFPKTWNGGKNAHTRGNDNNQVLGSNTTMQVTLTINPGSGWTVGGNTPSPIGTFTFGP